VTGLVSRRPTRMRADSADDVGKLHHDEQRDVWYECVYDPRKRVYTWAILPPADS
jgi:hypothetical protein